MSESNTWSRHWRMLCSLTPQLSSPFEPPVPLRIRGENGYAPYPGFLTETLRTQARFHDVDGSSIFSWSDTTRRFAQWAEAYSQSHPQTRSSSPTTAASSRNASPAPRGRGGAETPPSAGGGLPFGPPFGRPMRVRSSNPKGEQRAMRWTPRPQLTLSHPRRRHRKPQRRLVQGSARWYAGHATSVSHHA